MLPTSFFQAMPKIALHDHLLGTVREATFQDLARQRGAAITAEAIAAFYRRGDKLSACCGRCARWRRRS